METILAMVVLLVLVHNATFVLKVTHYYYIIYFLNAIHKELMSENLKTFFSMNMQV